MLDDRDELLIQEMAKIRAIPLRDVDVLSIEERMKNAAELPTKPRRVSIADAAEMVAQKFRIPDRRWSRIGMDPLPPLGADRIRKLYSTARRERIVRVEEFYNFGLKAYSEEEIREYLQGFLTTTSDSNPIPEALCRRYNVPA